MGKTRPGIALAVGALSILLPAASALGAPEAPSEAASPAVVQGVSPAVVPTAQVSATPPETQIEFDLGLQLRDNAGAVALEQAVSDPSSPRYGHYLTPEEWEARFSPSPATVEALSGWLQAHAISVQAVTPDRMTIEARASAATIESAFGTSFGEYRRGRSILRLAKEALKVPSSLAPSISGITGIDEGQERPAALRGPETRPQTAAGGATGEPTPAFHVGKPCSRYYGQKYDTTDPPYGKGYPYPLPYAPCGYTPPQFQGAYGLSPLIASGVDGKGVKVAIVDALASPTLFSDAREYSERNQPEAPLKNSQFSEVLNKPFEVTQQCEEEDEWADEQHLDVEAVHATSPGADIVYVGAKTCSPAALENAVQQVVDGHLAEIVTDSWGEDAGDLLEPEGARKAFDHVLLMAAGTGVGVQFSSGDEGDNFPDEGIDAPGYPASSPYATAVGGTTLEIGKGNVRTGEFGWSTGESLLCTPLLEAEGLPGCNSSSLESWLPPAPGAYHYAGGGGTSYVYPEPKYQDLVVPAALAERNSAITGTRNRVVPDISMEGDPSTGLLYGETETFPDGARYGEARAGGTSLSSPLLAGLLADADQAAGKPLGFVNPALYALDSLPASAEVAFDDIVPGGKQALARPEFIDELNAQAGVLHEVRTIEYEGREEFCDEAGHCSRQKVSLETTPGFDSMTGIGSPGEGLIAALSRP